MTGGDGKIRSLKALFRSWVTDPERRDFLDRAIQELRGHDLGCWCGVFDPCHVDVWLDLANTGGGR